MQTFPNNDINEIMNIEGNDKCFDCQAENPTHASTINGIFLCEKCAFIHNQLSPQVSQIKSLTKDQFTPEEISILKIGGNARFNNFLKEYDLKIESNIEYKYHLKLAEYYRSLLKAEIYKENNPEEYNQLINNKPGPEIGLQFMESLSADHLKKLNQQPPNELIQDFTNFTNKVGSFFTILGNKINETANKFGINQKIEETRAKFNQGVKTFGENHPNIQNAATKTAQAFTTAKNYTTETFNKIAESPTVKNITDTINNKYNEVVNSETMKNFEKATSEQYHKLKTNIMNKKDDNVNNINNVPQEPNNEQANNINNVPQEPNNEQANNINNAEQNNQP